MYQINVGRTALPYKQKQKHGLIILSTMSPRITMYTARIAYWL